MTLQPVIKWTLADAMRRAGDPSWQALNGRQCMSALGQLSQHTRRADDHLSALYAQLAADAAAALAQPLDTADTDPGTPEETQTQTPAENAVIFSLEVQDLMDYIELDEEIEPNSRARSLDILEEEITPQVRRVIDRVAGQYDDRIRQVYHDWTDSLNIAAYVH